MINSKIELTDYRFILCGFDHYNILNALRSLHDKGINPIVIIRTKETKSFLVKYSNFVTKYHEVEDAESGLRLILDYKDDKSKGFLISCDDWFEECFDQHYDDLKDFFYFFDGGSAGVITKFLKKYELCMLAEECGLKC